MKGLFVFLAVALTSAQLVRAIFEALPLCSEQGKGCGTGQKLCCEGLLCEIHGGNEGTCLFDEGPIT